MGDVIDIVPYLNINIHECSGCKLKDYRTQVVLGSGNPEASIMLIGCTPGEEEDEMGIPFIGRAGLLLNKALLKAGLHRSDIYMTHICKCRPPSNRNPEVSEVDACLPWLRAEVEEIQPKIIGTFGTFATQVFLAEVTEISKARGKVHMYEKLPIFPMYHPNDIMRNMNSQMERDFYKDILKLKEEGEK